MGLSAEKKSSLSRVHTVKVVSNEHLNANNTLFGGYLMCWIDEVAFMCACRYAGRKTCVTVSIDDVSFMQSQKLGDHVHLSAQVVRVGQSSMQIVAIVEVEDTISGVRTITNKAHLTFVALGNNLKPSSVPKLILDTLDSEGLHREHELRSKVKKRMSRFIEKGKERRRRMAVSDSDVGGSNVHRSAVRGSIVNGSDVSRSSVNRSRRHGLMAHQRRVLHQLGVARAHQQWVQFIERRGLALPDLGMRNLFL